jgi:hypothetical protein
MPMAQRTLRRSDQGVRIRPRRRRTTHLLETVPYYDTVVEILRSAFLHGVSDQDVQHALRHAAVVEAIAEDPIRYLVLGPDRAANLLELVVIDRPQGPAVMHAMPMRPKYRRLLPKDR